MKAYSLLDLLFLLQNWLFGLLISRLEFAHIAIFFTLTVLWSLNSFSLVFEVLYFLFLFLFLFLLHLFYDDQVFLLENF